MVPKVFETPHKIPHTSASTLTKRYEGFDLSLTFICKALNDRFRARPSIAHRL